MILLGSDFMSSISMSNTAAHIGKKITYEQAMLCLENLYIFMDFISFKCENENFDKEGFEKMVCSIVAEFLKKLEIDQSAYDDAIESYNKEFIAEED